jgi:amino acid transporter
MQKETAQQETEHTLKKQGNLSTFAGVFTPSILTILGIILFLRLGYVVGSAGLGHTLIILVLANSISVLTTISLSAIATNIKVKGGGDYYLISRTLGLEFGGAIGIVLFLAQSVSIGFYCVGFGEVLAELLPMSVPAKYLPQIIAAVAIAFLFIFAWLGADWATRFQYVVMGIIVAALISFFMGGLTKWDASILVQNWKGASNASGFWILFAIFFPAVTGFTQGVSMSGDLKDPGKSLPLGTFFAVGVSIVIYFFASIVFSAALPQEVLMNDYGAMEKVAAFDFIITAGVIAATLSSAMASFLGAPRILQSLAADRIFPFLLPFAKGIGLANNPRRGVLLAGGIAYATIALGNLNLIAPVVSMFFLISYGLLNYATYFETRAASPSFRPRFRYYDGRLSLIGALACLGVMLAIDLPAGIAAVAVLFSIYQYLQRTAGPARWADGKRSYHLKQVREHLLAAASEPEHPRDWRPQLLLFSDNPEKRSPLLQLASWITGDSGLITAVRVVEGRGAKVMKLHREIDEALRRDLAVYETKIFPLVVTAEDFDQGVDMLVQASGIGPLKINTILFNWLSREHQGSPHIRKVIYDNRLKTVFRQGRNIIVLDAKPDSWEELGNTPKAEHRIDVWWWNDASSRLMILLAHLMTRSKAWHEAKIRCLDVSLTEDTQNKLEKLGTFLDTVRINAEPMAVENADADTIAENSKDATLVFLPFRLKGNQSVDPFGDPLENLLDRLPSVTLVLAAEDIDLDADPEEGKAGELAAALDSLADAEKTAQKAKKDAAKASEEYDRQLAALAKAEASETNETNLSKIRNEVFEAEIEAEKAARRFAKAEAKARNAIQQAEELGAKLPDKNEDDPDQPAEEEQQPPKLP